MRQGPLPRLYAKTSPRPYSYAYWKHGGRTRSKYIGKDLPASIIVYEKDSQSEEYIARELLIPAQDVNAAD